MCPIECSLLTWVCPIGILLCFSPCQWIFPYVVDWINESPVFTFERKWANTTLQFNHPFSLSIFASHSPSFTICLRIPLFAILSIGMANIIYFLLCNKMRWKTSTNNSSRSSSSGDSRRCALFAYVYSLDLREWWTACALWNWITTLFLYYQMNQRTWTRREL